MRLDEKGRWPLWAALINMFLMSMFMWALWYALVMIVFFNRG